MKRAASNGFTLVEVLVAMTVMAIMAVMAWQGVDGIVRTRNASQARLEQTLRLNTVIAQWDQDLASIQDTGGTIPISPTCDGASVRLTRRTPDGIQVVAWSLRPSDTGSTWIRWASPAVTTVAALQDSWFRSLQLQGDEPGSLRTLNGLSTWQVYFYRDNAWTNCQSSAGTAANPATGAATVPGTVPTPGALLPSPRPNGVRVVLSFAPGSGLNGDLTRDTLLNP